MLSEYAAAQKESVAVAPGQCVLDASEAIAEALVKLEALRQELIELCDSGKLSREIWRRIVSRAAEFDGRLMSTSDRLAALGAHRESQYVSGGPAAPGRVVDEPGCVYPARHMRMVWRLADCSD